MKCYGRNLNDHCCYVNNKPCPFLEENIQAGYRWSCKLRRKTGSWKATIVDPRYNDISKIFAQYSYKNCKNYQCEDCGKLERGEINQQEFERLRAS